MVKWSYKELTEMVNRVTKANAVNDIDLNTLLELFDYLESQNVKNTCDDTLRFTNKFLEEKKLNKDLYTLFIYDLGGFCDCEVLSNVKGKIRRARLLDKATLFKQEAIGRLRETCLQILERKWHKR